MAFPLGDLVQDQPVEGSITVPSTHIYGQVVGGSNCYIRQEECIDIEPNAPNGWRFKITGNNPYLVAEFDSGY